MVLKADSLEIIAMVEEIINKPKQIEAYLITMQTKKGNPRFEAYLVLYRLTTNYPEQLYPFWDRLVPMLEPTTPTDHKYEAINLIVNMLPSDVENKFDMVVDNYFALLDDDSIIPPGHVALRTGDIIKAKPHLEPIITEKLLQIDKTHHDPQRKALISANIIESMIQYYPIAKNKSQILEFVKSKQTAPSPKAKKNAKLFLKKYQ